MSKPEFQDVTQLLSRWSAGDKSALDDLMPVVYDELRRMARSCRNRQRSGETMQTTALINEAYLKLAGNREKEWKNRAHFFGVASTAMRHILVDYARSQSSKKRGGENQRITFVEEAVVSKTSSDEIVALDEALNKLTSLDERKSRVVEMKYFAGLKFEEIAEVLGVSIITAKRDWSFAKNWLLKQMSSG